MTFQSNLAARFDAAVDKALAESRIAVGEAGGATAFLFTVAPPASPTAKKAARRAKATCSVSPQ